MNVRSDDCPSCRGQKQAGRIVCYDCWRRVDHPLKHTWEISKAFGPSEMLKVADQILKHLAAKKPVNTNPSANSQLSLL